MRSKKHLLLFVLILSGVVFSVYLFYVCYRTAEVEHNDNSFLTSLKDYQQFREFAGAPLDNAYPGISSVKVVYDLRREQIYFMNSHLYRLHYDFCSKVLGFKLGLALFNIANYGEEKDY